MRILKLSLTNFRCFKRAEIDFSDKLNLIYGNNAQGKTSILEAIHFISLLTSPLASHDREIINFEELNQEIPVSRLITQIEKVNSIHNIEIRVYRGQSKNGNGRLKKEVLMDGVKKKLLEMVGFFNSVLFLPQMTRIVEDGPEERRRYLDQILSQAYPGYASTLNEYLKTLSRRNALLKQLLEQGGDLIQLDYWDQKLVKNGAFLLDIRHKAIDVLDLLIRSVHREFTSESEELSVRYHSNVSESDVSQMRLGLPSDKGNSAFHCLEDLEKTFLQKLLTIRKEELKRGHTLIGPHRDDLLFSLNGVDLGKYGSRGQIRSAVMSLKFAEKSWLREKTGEDPVILMDETLAELDKKRREGLLLVLNNHSQAVLTTADMELFPQDLVQQCAIWNIEDHQIRKISP